MDRNGNKQYSLAGVWQCRLADGSEYTLTLPGTLDTNGIGYPDKGADQWHPDAGLGNADDTFCEDAPIATRFTRKHTYEGEALLTREFSYQPRADRRVFLEAERARCLRLILNGSEIAPQDGSGTLSTPYVFEVTGLLEENNKITLVSDNSYPQLPHDDIVYSSAATDETQTNWNGVLGYIRLREEPISYISAVRVYPHAGAIDVEADVSCAEDFSGEICLHSKALKTDVIERITAPQTTLRWSALPCAEEVRLWDEYEGRLYTLTVTLGEAQKTVSFGIREYAADEKGRLTLNNRCIFIRSEANCAEFPEEGHPPMDEEAWMDILSRYKDYGVNYMRFHSHCPPEAAFAAADRLGILMQPELSHWNPKNAFETDESYAYYEKELCAIIRTYANHPSFVALTLGNELHNHDLGYQRMRTLMEKARTLDATRMYAIGSNAYYGAKGADEASDFYTSQKYYDEEIRGCFAAESEKPGEKGHLLGYINNEYPTAAHSYSHAMSILRDSYKKPVFSFEVGQYEILPDFAELSAFHGISEPANLRLIEKRVEEAGLTAQWREYVEATGELSLIGYREEVEAVLRTPELSGISLLGLQDFPGQGTALVGMMNSHLEAKPYNFARPERFRSFFRESLPMAALPKYTYEAGETLRAPILVANYGKQDIEGELCCTLSDGVSTIIHKINNTCYGKDRLTTAGEVAIPLTAYAAAKQLTLELSLTDAKGRRLLYNSYPLWVYPKVTPRCPDTVYEARHFDEQALRVLAQGGVVYLSPDATKEALPCSIRTQFTTDFWSVGTFAAQEGGMGQYIDTEHLLFKDFPTQKHTNWQWWAFATQRAVILPRKYEAIVAEMDSYAYLRPMAQLIEWRCAGGRVLLSTFGLHKLQQYPEARALQAAIYGYLASPDFSPAQSITPDELGRLVH